MTRRAVRKTSRAFYRFPWTPAAIDEAVSIATISDGAPSFTLRGIADKLLERGLVTTRPDPATVRRMLAKQVALAKLEQQGGRS